MAEEEKKGRIIGKGEQMKVRTRILIYNFFFFLFLFFFYFYLFINQFGFPILPCGVSQVKHKMERRAHGNLRASKE